MAYASRGSNGNRATTAVIVAVLQGAALYALMTGLAVNFIPSEEVPPTAGYQIPLTPPPEPPKTVEKAETPVPTTTPVFTPRLIDPMKVTLPPFPVIDNPIVSPSPSDFGQVIEREPDPVPSFTPRAPIPRNAGQWASSDDYPTRDIREGNEGTTRFELTVSNDGKVQSCRVVASSGFASLDTATCKLVSGRARFQPATDGSGARASGTYTGSVRWQIPKD